MPTEQISDERLLAQRDVPRLAGFEKMESELAESQTQQEPLEAGRSFPLGATVLGEGVNFSVYSRQASRLDLLPVVSRANVHQLEGVVTLPDVLALYGVGSKES